MAHYRHTNVPDVPIQDIERQQRFELRCIEEGARRVRDTLQREGLADSVVGHRLIRKIAGPMLTEIDKAREEVVASLTSRGNPPSWSGPFLALDRTKLMVVTLVSLFRCPTREGSLNYPISRVASTISGAIRVQLDFEKWVSDEKARKKNGEVNTDLDEFKRSFKNADAKTWGRYKAKISRARMEPWSPTTGIKLGVKCVDLLVQAKPEWFSVATNPIGRGKYETQLMLSQDCRDVINGMIEREELANPRLMPMLCPPEDWVHAA